MIRRGGFLPGMGVGALLAIAGVVLVVPWSGGRNEQIVRWIVLNLGSASWLFAAVLVLFIVHLVRLARLLDGAPERHAVVELDQLTDVWTHVFVGIGVIWTAVGMRSALQFTLADPEQVLSESAGTMLQRLVDGGILLALTTTIVGAVGGYLLRIAKTLYVGAALHEFYDRLQHGDMRELLITVQRLERCIEANRGAEGGRAEESGRAPV